MPASMSDEERARVAARARRVFRGCRAALWEFPGFGPDFDAGLYGPQRSNHHPVGEDGRVEIASPYPEPFWAVMVLRNAAGAPVLVMGPNVVGPNDFMWFDANTFEVLNA